MLASVTSAALTGIDAVPVRAEANISNGLPDMYIVGLPDAAVKESRERVRAALQNSGPSFPMRRMAINLAPADIRKEGPAFDLPIALALLDAQAARGRPDHHQPRPSNGQAANPLPADHGQQSLPLRSVRLAGP